MADKTPPVAPTPGPWLVGDVGPSSSFIDITHRGLFVARVLTFPYLPDQARANARMIGASGELLAVCRDVLTFVDTQHLGEALETRLKAAIAKATLYK